jgi:heat shock protein HslJ
MTRVPATRRILPGILLALAGCAGTGTTGEADATLTDTYWALLEVDGNSFPEYQGTREPHIVFRREGERVSGFAGCNVMAGGYQATGERLRVGPLALTRMACLGAEATTMESAFVRALDDTASYRIEGSTLELRDAAGKPRLRLEARGTAR